MDFADPLNAPYRVPELILITIATVFGARMLAIDSGQFTIVPRIQKLAPHLSEDAYNRWDLLFVVFFGTLVAFAFAAPSTPQHAVAAGLAWTSMVQIGNEVNTALQGGRKTSNGKGESGMRYRTAELEQSGKAAARPKRPT
jgi:hypothetical protein